MLGNDFDPNGPAHLDSGVFGLPFSAEESKLVLIPVPWEVTTSYRRGTMGGPTAIFQASRQVDLNDFDVIKPYQPGIAWNKEEEKVCASNKRGSSLAEKVIDCQIKGKEVSAAHLEEVNRLGKELNDWVESVATQWLDKEKFVGVVGGDHSVPLGAFRAAGKKKGKFGILHIDAHSDTRNCYEGFTYSHASIMRNALNEVPEIEKIVQVGIRDYCEEEEHFCKEKGEKLRIFFDYELARRKQDGEPWLKIVASIVEALPEKVWISFDIDGLDPRYCPNTGTPVPGGLDFHEVNALFRRVVEAGKQIIGFDLCEVSPSKDESEEWDANVGARILYKMSGWLLASQGLVSYRRLR